MTTTGENDAPDLETRSSELRDAATRPSARVPGLTILAHPAAARVGERVALPELVSGRSVGLSRLKPSFGPPEDDPAAASAAAAATVPPWRPLAEVHLSRRPILLRPGEEPGSVVAERAGSRTRLTAGGETVDSQRTFSAAELDEGVVLVLSERIALLLHFLEALRKPAPEFGFVGSSDAMLRVRCEIERAAALEVPVLLRGETGTGKELAARALHAAGRRRERPYVALNMAAVPPSLAAAELFGAARGAYTGADRKKTGYFERADGGTLFLDEIGETPPEVQPLLLRVLESGEIQPVGSAETRRVDVRLVAATDVDLEAAIAAGRFRATLLHRLAGYAIRLPPLRERRDDVAPLLVHFLRQELARLGDDDPWADGEGLAWLSPELVGRLTRHCWPGNVRQLRNAARRLAIAGREGSDAALGALVDELLREGVAPAASEAAATSAAGPRTGYRKPEEVGEDELLAALRAHRWRPQPAAAALGVSRGTLYRLIESCPRIRKASELDREQIEAALAACGSDPLCAAAELEVSPQGLRRRMAALGLD